MDIESTTHTDVPNDTPAASNNDDAPKSPRELAMEAIANQHTQRMAAESGVEIDPDADNDTDTSIVDPDAQINAQLNDSAPAAQLPPTVKVKIDGQEADVPLDEVVREFQKKGAADARLAEAARMKRELADQQAAIAAQQQQLLQLQQQLQAQQQAPAVQPNTPSDSSAPEESGKEFLRALFEGDEETALAKLSELTTGRQGAQAQQPTLDITQLTQAVTQQVQQQLHVESALTQHRKDYPQVYSDPDMEGFVLAKVNSRRQESGEDFFVALNAVSADFAAKFGWTQESPGRQQRDAAPTTTNPRAAKLERKANIDNVTSINTKTTSTESGPENPSDVIAAMRRQRAGG